MIRTLFNKAAGLVGRGAAKAPIRQGLTITDVLPPGGVTGGHIQYLQNIRNQRVMRDMQGLGPSFKPFHPTPGVQGSEGYGRALLGQSARGAGAQRGSFNIADVNEAISRQRRGAGATIMGTPPLKMPSSATSATGRDWRGALSTGLGWAGRHHEVVGAGIGAATGFMASGGSGWGALTGAAVGGIAGGRVQRDYQVGSKSFSTKMAGKIGRQFTRHAPGFSQTMAKGRILTSTKGHARNIGGKFIGQQVVASAKIAGLGVGAGLVTGMGVSAIKGIGSTYGSRRNTTYGTAFSGMGNGTVTQY